MNQVIVGVHAKTLFLLSLRQGCGSGSGRAQICVGSISQWFLPLNEFRQVSVQADGKPRKGRPCGNL